MDKKLGLEKSILAFLESYAPIIPYGMNNVRNQIIADRENGHYQLVRLGWDEGAHIHYTVFHFDIIDGKVWVQENRTDLPIIDELEGFGISSEDLVLNFWQPAEVA